MIIKRRAVRNKHFIKYNFYSLATMTKHYPGFGLQSTCLHLSLTMQAILVTSSGPLRLLQWRC